MEFVLQIYADLMERGWKMHEIDKIDPVWYFSVRAYQAEERIQKEQIDAAAQIEMYI